MEECASYLKNLFQSKGTSDSANILGCETQVVTKEVHHRLLKPCTYEEIKRVTFQLGGARAPGLNGFSVCAYRKCWDVVGPDIIHVIKNYLSNDILDP